MNIVVCVKYVPDAQSERSFGDSDNTTDREDVDGLLSELDEYAVEEALKLAEARRGRGDRPHRRPGRRPRTPSRRRCRWAPTRGSTSVTTPSTAPTPWPRRWCSPRRSGKTAPDLVLTGMASTDGAMSVVPAMLAERLGLPQVTFASELTVDGDTVRIRRDGDVASETITATLPALVSVTDQINEPRYPSFKGIMAAKKKPVEQWGLADLGIDAAHVGLDAAWTTVVTFAKRPPREQGPIVTDEGDGGTKLAEFLAAQKFL